MPPNMSHDQLLQLQLLLMQQLSPQQPSPAPDAKSYALQNLYMNMLHQQQQLQQQQQMMVLQKYIQAYQHQQQQQILLEDLRKNFEYSLESAKAPEAVVNVDLEKLESPALKRGATTEVECEAAKRPCSSSSLAHSSSASSPSVTNQEAPGYIHQKNSTSLSDTECDEFIDVVGDSVPKTKAQRKAHIEFYRKIKLLRNREDSLQCSICSKSVQNIENVIRAHITSHTDASVLICKICGYSTGDLHAIFQHMKSTHSAKHKNSYEDRRNMEHLSNLLTVCFPRTATNKQKNNIQDYIQRLLDNVKNSEGNVPEIDCGKCQKSVLVTKEGLTKHLNQHHVYRCKKCKQINESEDCMKTHLTEAHATPESKIGSEYHISSATEAIVGVFRSCFGKHLE